jgi:ABC-2 type transport system permease protein
MGILLALIKKELIQTFRDKRLRVVIFAMPIIQMTVFGFAISNEVKRVPISVCDQDMSPASRLLTDSLTQGDYFVLNYMHFNCDDAAKDLENNRSKIAVIIPPDFQKKKECGDSAEVQILIDGSDGNSAAVASGYMIRILRESALAGSINTLPVIAGAAVAGIRPPPPPDVSADIRVWYNPSLESRYFLIPGIITMIITLIVTLLTAMGITREKEAGTFEQLIVSPISGWQLILGKTLPFLLVGILDVFLISAVSKLIFHMPFNGPLIVFFMLNIIYIFAMLGLGLFISSISKTQQQAMMTVFALLFPFIILSDFFFPVENMPELIQIVTLINPMRYSLVAQREILLKGSGWEQVGDNILILLMFAIFFVGYGAIRFRKSLAS